MTLDGPTSDDRFYLDNWKPVPTSPVPSPGSVASSDTAATVEMENTWRHASISNDMYDENSMWTPSAMATDYSGQSYNYPSPTSDSKFCGL